MNKTKHI